MKERACQWCGAGYTSPVASRLYCGRGCKDKAGNYFCSRGKVVMPMLLAWRARRGRKGTSGAEAYREMQQFVDACCAELSAQGSPPARFYEANPDKWMDRQRVRPSRVVDDGGEEE